MNKKNTIIIPAIILALLLFLLGTCKNPIDSVRGGSADVTLTCIIPDYFSGVGPEAEYVAANSVRLVGFDGGNGTQDSATQPRLIDPATYSIRITVSADDMDTIEQNFTFDDSGIYTGGKWIIECLVRNIPAGPNRLFTVETRDAAGTLLTRGTILMSLTSSGEPEMTVPMAPADAPEVGLDEILSGTVSYGKMAYHEVTFIEAGTYRISLTSDVDVDLYLFDTDGALFSDAFWERAAPTDEDAVVEITEADGTLFVGVFGNTLGDAEYSISAAPVRGPVPGGSGVLTVSDKVFSSVTLSWTAASDDMTDLDSLEYRVYRSTADDIGSAEEALANGTAATGWTTGMTSASVTGLSTGVTYYLNVLVKDRDENIAAYTGKSVQMDQLPSEIAKLYAADGSNSEMTYGSTAISGDGKTIVATAHWDQINTTPAQGSAYIFTETGGTWSQAAKIVTEDGAEEDQMGYGKFSSSVSYDGSVIAIGVYRDNTTGNGASTSTPGAVYVFERGAGWQDYGDHQAAKLTASEIGTVAASAGLGYAVDISPDGTHIIASASGYDTGGTNGGAAFLFIRSGSNWADGTESAVLTRTDDGEVGTGEIFGWPVAISADNSTIVVSDWKDVGGLASWGAGYVFKKPTGGWVDTVETAKLFASSPEQNNYLGTSIEVSEDGSVVALGCSGDQYEGVTSGSVFVFTEPPTGWENLAANETAVLTSSDRTAGDSLGNNGLGISDDGNIIAAGTIYHDTGGKDGAVYVFAKPVGGWADCNEVVKLTASDGNANDDFGYSLSMSADGGIIAVLGARAPGQTPSTGEEGAVYVYE